METVVIVDYGSGNLHSAGKAFERAARDNGMNARILLSARPEDVATADRIVLPGVGAFGDCMNGLEAIPGMREAIEHAIRRKGRPFLGICVGMQLMASRGLEHGVHDGLGWVEGCVRAITPDDPSLKIPHMGWNTLDIRREHELLEGIETGCEGWHAYFVHSFHMETSEPSTIVASTPYGGAVTAMIARDNMAGTQFHPEKSQKLGLRLIANFLRWRP